MFHSRTMNNKINPIHERALRLVYFDHVSSFDELLKEDRSLSIHHRNIQSLATELYKFYHGLSPSIIKNVFHFDTSIQYNLRSHSEVCSRNPKTVKYGTESRLPLKNVTDTKEFWKTVKPFLSDKVTTFPKISLVEKGKIISDESKVANSFSNFFENAIRSLGIKANEHSQENYDLKNPVEIAIKKFEQHPSINLINKNITNNENFHFLPGYHENILKEIINLDNKNN